MSDAFDPYHKWLGIPPGEQPPHHYRLLGIMPFESDADVISNAADQRMVHVRSFQSGKHSALSQKLLNEIAAARVCLLDRQKKQQYDGLLRSRLQSQPATLPVPGPANSGLSPSEVPSLPPPLPGTVPLPAAPQAGSPITASLAGKITAADAARAEGDVRAGEQAVAKLERARKKSRSRLRWNAIKLGWAELIVRARPLAEKAPLGRLGVTIVTVGLSFAVGLIAASIVTLRGAPLAAGGLLAMFFGAAVAVLALFFPPDTFLVNWIQWLRNESARLWAAVEQADRDIAQAKESVERARQEHGRLVEVLQSRRHRLLTTDWRSLRGQPFVDFLQAVFEEFGYVVRRIETAGNPGVDLTVAREGVSVAVQAKGSAEPVGDGAVRQVHGGMTVCKCQRCALITNAGYTPEAQQAAIENGCMLIDGSQIPALLDGRISV